MSNPLQHTIEALAKEKGLEPDVIIAAIEDAVLAASRKYYKSNEDLRTKFNAETGEVELFAVRQIVNEVTDSETEISLEEAQELYGAEAEVDMRIEFPKATDVLGRIAAQTAKQVIFQKVREAERENIYAEYCDRVGEVINGLVKRFESGDVIVEMGWVEALLPRKEQSRVENYTAGDRVRAVIKEVNRVAKGPQITLSRTDPALLIKLFDQEVPEIYDGTVQIRGAVREAGDRAKVAVFSRERDVDPVGACVGMKGTRVQSIIRELRGEKIDIVEWSDDPVVLVTNAISPARVQRVTVIDEAEKVMEVVVEDRQLSLAIGKKGQNVRLAAKLTGWKIDIKSEEEKRREVEAQFEGFDAERAQADIAAALLSLRGFDEGMWQTLQDSSLNTAEPLIHLATQELEQILGISDELAKAIQKVALDTVSARRPAEALDALFGSGPDQVETPVDGGETPASASSDTISETPEAATSEVAADQTDIKSENVVDPITVDTSTSETVEKQEPSK
ncbi:MAG: transcription termination factor NusA [Vicinamibacterales bacterium]|jgi:N utilization substance protein A|nr:antitermination protein NusA [Acidobacteriota bacterium]MDP7211873.1 transcription termination factor NusA [Vicinamibacterales bacterium]HJO17449.1 transcription termination factor NusA [Vicinamibacterales bacterium]|tara:strand:- start:353 stop:1873 length:1521 start_codon:yes stop_codon:yes gene_type:complete